MPQIPYVRSGEKLHITAKTLNAVAEHINGAVTISAGIPNKGGGGSAVVEDNTPDIFKIRKNAVGGVIISGGLVYFGNNNFMQFYQYAKNISANNIPTWFVNDASVDNVIYHYIEISFGTDYNFHWNWFESQFYVADIDTYSFKTTVAKSIWKYNTDTQLYDNTGIEQHVYPSNMIITNRWV